MTKAALVAFSGFELFNRLPFNFFHLMNHHLSYPVSGQDGLVFIREVNKDHFDLSPVIGVYSTG